MKIRKQNENCKEFRFVDLGDVFRRVETTLNYYMRIEICNSTSPALHWNAVNLLTGELVHFDEKELMILVECELVVK